MQWTDEQRAAIERKGNLIVSASAGAGKTAVLTERLCNLVSQGCPVEEMLVLTFTRAAAAEMRARITARLESMAAEERDPARRSLLYAQSCRAPRAEICTIDAFCIRVVRRDGHALGLSPDIRVGDDMELASLAAGVRDGLLTELAAASDEDYLALLAAFGGERAAWEAVESVCGFLQSEPEPETWLAGALGRYADAAWGDTLLSDVVEAAKSECALCVEALAQARDLLAPGMAKAIAVLEGDALQLRGLLLESDYDRYRQALGTLSFATLRFPKDTEESDKTAVKRARENVKKTMRAQSSLFLRDAAGERTVLAQSGMALRALFSVVRRYLAALSEAKAARGVMDFSDGEHFALAILSEPQRAAEYRSRYRYIAVDEYQDSNRVQEALLARIARPDNLFFVGDVKQSIYRFRQADPALFLGKLARYGAGEGGTRLDLVKNFRSAKNVIACVNGCFSAIMHAPVGEMEYDARARLVPAAQAPEGGAELHLIDRAAAETDMESAEDAVVEARFAASRIRQMLAEERCTDARTGEKRPYAYSDFAILMRSVKNARLVAQTLTLEGIPCYAQSSGGYFDALEVSLALDYLRVLDNRRRDVPLLAVMRAGAGGFTDADLAEIRARAGGKAQSYFACLSEAAEGDDALSLRCKAFLSMLDAGRRESRLVSVEALLASYYDDSGLYDEMGALPGGSQRQANLDALLRRAAEYAATGGRGISGFLSRMDNAAANRSAGSAQSAAADVVRILSMHKSKGLEYPAVFLLGLGTRFNLSDRSERLLLHTRLGAGLRFLDADGVQRDTSARRAIARKLTAEQLAEEMRVLYVGMTRARERLLLVGCASDPAALLEGGERQPSSARVARASTPLHWLTMGERQALPAFRHSRSAFLRPDGQMADASIPHAADAALVSAIRARLAWTYPYAEAAALPAKASVSRLLSPDPLSSPPPVFEAPAFAKEAGETASRRGSAVHAVLRALPLRPVTEGEVQETAAALIRSGVLSEGDGERLPLSALAAFTLSPLYSRLARSHRVEREWDFSVEAPALALFPASGAAGETVLLQGVMDCCFLDPDAATEAPRWVLLDYKTDRVPPGASPESFASRHARQLALYASALEKLTKTPVSEQYVVLLSAGVALRVNRGREKQADF